MKVRIGGGATDSEAEAVAAALAEHVSDDVEVYLGDAEEPAAVHEAPEDADDAVGDETDDLGPTEREELLREEIADILEGGPEKYKERLPDQDKLFVRDRLDLWFGEEGGDGDGDLLFEDGKFAHFDGWHPNSPDVDEADDGTRLPADGLITGAADFDGRDVHFMANDFTVKAGSMAERGVEKFLRMQQRALKTGKPVLYLMDSSGGRIDQQSGFFANREGIGKYYFNHSRLSGRVPQVCVLYGPCIAGAAYTPVFADYTIMVEGMSAMAIASPRMVEMVTGEKIEMQDLGGAQVHAEESGSADLVARDERHARHLVAQLVQYLPNKAGEKPPRSEPENPTFSPEGIDSVVPERPNRGYDMHDLIERVVDQGSYFELKPEYGKEILTAFARIDGRPVGIVANQPAQRAG